MKIISGSIENVHGIKAYTATVGLKTSGKKDFAVIYSEKLANAAAVFTKNKLKAAPLIVTENHLKDGKAQAVVINSGIANAGTGKQGITDAEETCLIAAKELGINKKHVVVASTGVIGKALDMEKIKKGLSLAKSRLKKESISDGIMTTDTKKKELAVKIGKITIGAAAKGAGMIHPNMATMLCFICTDAEIGSGELASMLKSSVDKSFNMISVDGDTSTNDMAIILANGMAGKISNKEFQEALDFICIELAKKIAADGEGATKLVEVEVKGAITEEDAKKAAKSIISSNLVKAALFGNDPNFGRILCAIGNSGASFSEGKIDVYFGDKKIVGSGLKADFNAKEASDAMKKEKLKILVDLNQGKSKATAWGCDLSYEYVKINADYHT